MADTAPMPAMQPAPSWIPWALEKFGVPTVVLVLVLLAFAYYYKGQREDSQTEHRAFIQTLDKHNEALGKNTAVMEKVADKLESLDRRAERTEATVNEIRSLVWNRGLVGPVGRSSGSGKN